MAVLSTPEKMKHGDHELQATGQDPAFKKEGREEGRKKRGGKKKKKGGRREKEERKGRQKRVGMKAQCVTPDRLELGLQLCR